MAGGNNGENPIDWVAVNNSFVIIVPSNLKTESDTLAALKSGYDAIIATGKKAYVEDDQGEGILPYPRKPRL